MNAFNVNLPEDKSLVSTYYSEIRTMQEDIRDRLVLDHYMQSTIAGAADNDGYHKQLTLADNNNTATLTGASVLYVNELLGQSELIHKNDTYITPITYGTLLNYDTTQKITTSSYVFTGSANQDIALTNANTSYNFDRTIIFETPSVCFITMTPSTTNAASYTYYVAYLGANITINASVTSYPSIISNGVSLVVKPIMVLFGTCVFRHRFVESNSSTIPGASVSDARRTQISVSNSIIYNGV